MNHVDGYTLSGSLPSVTSTSTSNVASSVTVSSSNELEPTSIHIGRVALSEIDSLDLERRFNSANQALQAGGSDEAASNFQALIKDYPNFVEPYVNLAAIQAEQGDLEEARKTLTEASVANQSTKVLFDSIKQVHGALAAKAYRNALETAASAEIKVDLPKASKLATDFSQTQKIRELNALLEKQRSSTIALGEDALQLEKIRTQLADAKRANQALVAEQQLAVAAVNEALNKELEQTNLLRTQLNQLQKDSEKVDSDLVAKLRIELGNSESALQASRTKIEELTIENADLGRQIAVAQQAIASQPVLASNDLRVPTVLDVPIAAVPRVTSNQQKTVAIEFVQAWAEAWSAQDLQKYVGFYDSGYTPSLNLTHQQWLNQRKVRLTNKRFIEVKVSDFRVETEVNGFSVTFTQHYRSNTLDDTIRKKLVFMVPTGGDWSKAKVVQERIVKR